MLKEQTLPDASKPALLSAAEWFGGGRRVPYDPDRHRVLTTHDDLSTSHLMVFERVVGAPLMDAEGRWMTLPQVALVTGTSSGFGQATAALLKAQGFQVFGTSRAPLNRPSGSYEVLLLDVRSEASVQACVQTILQRTGRIDLLVNNAGFAQGGALEENSLEDARAQFDTNVFGVLRMLKAALPVMRELGGGQIITVSFSPRGGSHALSRPLCLQQIRAGGHNRGTAGRTAW